MRQKEGGSRSADKTNIAAKGRAALAQENKMNLPYSSSQVPASSILSLFRISSNSQV